MLRRLKYEPSALISMAEISGKNKSETRPEHLDPRKSANVSEVDMLNPRTYALKLEGKSEGTKVTFAEKTFDETKMLSRKATQGANALGRMHTR